MVKFLDVHAAYREVQGDIDAAVARVMDSGQYILGPEVDAFESEFAAFTESRHAIGVGNGLDALILALRALDISGGDEVLVPSHTFVATWLAVSMVGATPVPVDIDAATFNMDPDRIAAALTANTRAIIPVHLYGQPARLAEIRAIAQEHGLRVIEDAAQAHGASYRGQRIGAHGDLVCWSFYPGKNLGALGDGGGVTTDDSDLADRLRLLRNYGSTEKYRHDEIGVNSRLDPVQAATLRVKLTSLDEWNARRAKIASTYRSQIRNDAVALPDVLNDVEPVWHLFVVKTDHRDALQGHLAERDIQTLIHYPIPPFAQKAYKGASFDEAQSRVAAEVAPRILSLPIGPHMSESDVQAVIDGVNSFKI